MLTVSTSVALRIGGALISLAAVLTVISLRNRNREEQSTVRTYA
jgi:hypothetical protein